MPPREPTQALLETYLAKRPNLLRFVIALTGSRETADDVLQDLYLRLAEAAAPQDVRNPTALLYTMATNLARDRARSAARRTRREADWAQTGLDRLGGAAIDPEPPPDAAAADRADLRRLGEALDALPRQMQRAFRLHRIHGLSQAETAREMGISRKAVERYVAAALAKLARRLSP